MTLKSSSLSEHVVGAIGIKTGVPRHQIFWGSHNNPELILSQGFLMAEDLNGYFSSVFTKEDISSLPVADAKFQEAKSDYLGPLVVTQEMVAKKIKAMKDNKSPGVDGIPPKLLMESTTNQYTLARVFNLSLK